MSTLSEPVARPEALMELERLYSSGVYNKRPVEIVRGEGALLWDAQGRCYIDCAAGHGVANIGHGRAEMAAALAAQAQRLITCPESLYNDVRARLLERLAQFMPSGLQRFFLCNSGAEAVEGAIKFARLATGRPGIIATLRGFHGRTLGALSATWERSYREPFAPLVPGITHVRYNDLAALERAIDDQTAAVLLELVQGEGGVHVADPAYVRGLAALCRERGVLLIVDEVQTGCGRTGRFLACEHYELEPDLLCLAKGIAGGLPMGVVALGERVIASGRLTPGTHGSTFGGNPLVCAAALETLNIIERERLVERAAYLGQHALERLRNISSSLIREVRGLGLLLGVELRTRVQPYLEALLERGVLALPAGPNVIRLLPPLVISEEQLDQALNCLAEVLQANQPKATVERRAANPGVVSEGTAPQEQAELDLLYRMVSIPSLSGQERSLATWLVEYLPHLGLQAELDVVGNLVATVPVSAEVAERAPLVLLGHMDTVPGAIPVALREGKLYGRGAVDAKGPLAAFLAAAARLARREGTRLRRPIVVIGAVEEEAATSRGARAVVERYRPYACIIGEPSGSRAVTLGYKGRLLVDGRVVRPCGHSAGPRQTAVEAAVAFWERVRLHAEEWNRNHGGTSPFAALQPVLRSIESGQDGLQEWATLRIGYRLPLACSLQELCDELRHWAAQAELAVDFSGEEAAFQAPRTTRLVRAFVQAMRAMGIQPAFKVKTGTSDMNVVGPVWGPEIVAYGPGDARLDHTPEEHLAVEEYMEAIAILERVLMSLAQAEGEEEEA
ncbi:MAG: [LysW]-lysine hydrolase [Thermogemmatispora sp.]|uniref:[LysW]-lysine hydrolase n=1 Tax=Thermogemmatispora sp. TaxID=1968838 RepID=UPI001E121648|nr:[LysW]-lysine hydrolase [Thermogemmatispora sp.]MBX5450269.1 [LysW]-lysine hydrolase [Thermogemmatispora sp.]